MSVMYFSQSTLDKFSSALLSLCYSPLPGAPELRSFLGGLYGKKNCSIEGVAALTRLYHAANHRAYRYVYGVNESGRFTRHVFKRLNQLTAPSSIEGDEIERAFFLCAQARRMASCLNYNCIDSSAAVPAEDRYIWRHFAGIEQQLTQMMCLHVQSQKQWDIYSTESLVTGLNANLRLIASNGRLHALYALTGALKSFDVYKLCPMACEGARCVTRLMQVAERRAKRWRPSSHRDAVQVYLAPTICQVDTIGDTLGMLAEILKRIGVDGPSVSAKSRYMWRHFEALEKVLQTVMIENCAYHQAGTWGEIRAEIKKVYSH